ncbi:methionine--tRNA ligase, partial [Desulfovibrio sp. OttesenSCG-928-C06]|nr:methionine--tRNA ligase [Desulfovibrio sp. OttesenSCG-928-C06]
MSDKQTFYITTPIYYVNAKPHLGHAYTSTLTDCVTRYQRLSGKDSRMITGSDEHGDKIVQAAEKQGLTPQLLADGVSAEFQALLPRLGVDHNRFIRTSSTVHKANVQKFLQIVYDKGDIYFGEYGGHYCYGCERFYTEKELLEDGTCPQHLTKPEFISEKNYFFRMSKYSGWLKEFILGNPDFIRPERYRNEVLALLDSGELEDLCISRPKSRLTWGIELPFDKDYVCYVWFDALVSYITALDWAEGPDGPGSGDTFKKYWPAAQHIIAKDILKPHAIFWPTMLKSAGLDVYRHLNVHGYWLVRDTKMSKSLGNVIDPLKMIDTYGLDVFRYFVMREMHFGNDASFTEEGLIQRQNADLSNDLGNLFSRVLSMNAKYFACVTPEPGAYGEEEKRIQALATESLRNYQSLFDNFRFSGALDSLWDLVRALNKYVDTAAPWVLFKENKTAELGTVMYTLLECMRKIALHLWPIMPASASRMLEQLGQSFNDSAADFGLPGGVNLEAEAESFGSLKPGTTLAAASNLFPRLEQIKQEAKPKEDKKAKAAAKDAGSKEAATDAIANIEFTDFQKLDLRVGTILSAEKHPDADKLLCFKVDVGEAEPRSIVSGIAEFFKPEELCGKQVIVVANLPPRKIRKVESNGMLLTAEDENGLSLLSPGAAR